MNKKNVFVVLLVLIFTINVFAINISTCQGLQDMNLSLSGTYVLTQNIDCSATLTWGGGEGFKPVGTSASKFTGSFDGGGYTISNLHINRPTTDNVGLFGYTSSTALVQNIILQDVNIIGQAKTGALVGTSEGRVLSSTVKGKVSGTSEVGGMIGYYYRSASSSTIITGLRAEMSLVSGTTKVGGLIGYLYGANNYDLNLNNSSSIITLVTSTGSVGGLVGHSYHGYSRMYFNYCKSQITNRISSTGSYVGGLIGYSQGRSGAIYDSNVDVNYITATGDVSYIGGLVGYHDGTVSSSFAIVNSIDVNKTANTTQAVIGGLAGQLGMFSGGFFYGKATDSWAQVGNINVSLGTYSGYYVGGLVGDAYGEIRGCYSRGTTISSTKIGSGYVGGLVGKARISLKDSNAIFTDINAGSGSYVGGLVGEYVQSEFSGYDRAMNLFAQTGTISGAGYVGGLGGNFLGYSNTMCDFNNMRAIVTNIFARGNYSGGLFGFVGNNYNGIATINNSSSIITGKIDSTGSYVGGLVGKFVYNSGKILDSNSDVNYIYAAGDISYVGGLGGTVDGNIGRSYSRISNIDVLKTANTSAFIGGLVGEVGESNSGGYIWESGVDINNINNSLGTYSGGYVGGLVGDCFGGIESSYARGVSISSTKLSSTSVGGLAGRVKTKLRDSNSIFIDINAGSGSYVGGLVGDFTQSSLSGANIIRNLYVQTNSVRGGDYVGGLAGNFVGYSNTTATISNLQANTINIISSGQYTGGLLGYTGNSYNSDSNLINSKAIVTGLIQSTSSYVGGLVGKYGYTKSRIYDSNSDINYIYVSGDVAYIGGLVGEFDGNLFNSSAQVTISVNKTANTVLRLGGLIGQIGGTAGNGFITNSWADVNINTSIGTYSGYYIGGLVGRQSSTGTIKNCFSKGSYISATKTGGTQVGGLVGYAYYPASKIEDSYSSIETIVGGTNTKYGGLVGENLTIVDSFFSGTVSAGTSSGAICGTACASITNSYFLNGNDVNLYGGGRVSTQGSNYFKGNLTNEPMASWSFYNSQTNPSGVWYVWTGDYPHLSLSPVLTYYSIGTFISKAINLGGIKKFTTIDLDMLKPINTSIELQIKTATSEGGLTSAPWLGPGGTSDSNYSINGESISSVHDGNSWVQYKAMLSTNDITSTPKLYEVNIHTLAMGEIIYSKTGTNFSWVSFNPPSDTNGCTLNWFYSLSNSPYSWNSTSGTLNGSEDLWLRGVIVGTTDSNNFQFNNIEIFYAE